MPGALSISWVCLMLVWAPPAFESERPPVQRPSSRPVALAEPVAPAEPVASAESVAVEAPPAPVEPEPAPIEMPPVQAEPAPLPAPRATGQLPSYHAPIAADALS